MPTEPSFPDSHMSFDQHASELQSLQAPNQGEETSKDTSQQGGNLTDADWYKTTFGVEPTFPSYGTTDPLEKPESTASASDAKVPVRLDTLGRPIRTTRTQKQVTERTVNKGSECSQCVKKEIKCIVRLKNPSADCLGCGGGTEGVCDRSLVLELIAKRRSQANKRNWINKKNAKERKLRAETENSQPDPPQNPEDTRSS